MSLTSRRTVMARKRYKPEEIVAKLRQVDVLLSQGQNIVDAIRQIGVSEVTYSGVRRAENRAGEAPEGPWAREQPAAQGGFRSDAGQAHSAGGCSGKLLSPARRRACLSRSERSCMSPSVAPVRRSGSIARKVPRGRDDEQRLTADIIELARQYGRSRGVPWVLACAVGDGTRWRCGENGTAEDPGTVRQRVECLDPPASAATLSVLGAT